MTYRAQVARTAARQLAEQLPEAVAAACVGFLYGPLAENRHRVGAALHKPFEGYWRARRGEYHFGQGYPCCTRREWVTVQSLAIHQCVLQERLAEYELIDIGCASEATSDHDVNHQYPNECGGQQRVRIDQRVLNRRGAAANNTTGVRAVRRERVNILPGGPPLSPRPGRPPRTRGHRWRGSRRSALSPSSRR